MLLQKRVWDNNIDTYVFIGYEIVYIPFNYYEKKV